MIKPYIDTSEEAQRKALENAIKKETGKQNIDNLSLNKKLVEKEVSIPKINELLNKQGSRFNNGKLRYDLLEPFAIEQLVRVFTKGADKYAPNNWLRGLPWMDVVASLERHIAEFKKGDDFDSETGLLHMAHAAWNALAIVSYYKHRPEFDNRRHGYLMRPKIGLDIDEVLADWVGHWISYHGQSDRPESWNFDRDIGKKFEEMKDNKDFWTSIPVKTKPSDIPFEPHCYITSRSIPVEWTKEWLDKNKFPAQPVYSVNFEKSKLQVAKESGIDWYVDDRYENFVELNNAGICTFLFDSPHNQRYNVGFKRIKSLKELI